MSIFKYFPLTVQTAWGKLTCTCNYTCTLQATFTLHMCSIYDISNAYVSLMRPSYQNFTTSFSFSIRTTFTGIKAVKQFTDEIMHTKWIKEACSLHPNYRVGVLSAYFPNVHKFKYTHLHSRFDHL